MTGYVVPYPKGRYERAVLLRAPDADYLVTIDLDNRLSTQKLTWDERPEKIELPIQATIDVPAWVTIPEGAEAGQKEYLIAAIDPKHISTIFRVMGAIMGNTPAWAV